jgi:hypothetical protein
VKLRLSLITSIQGDDIEITLPVRQAFGKTNQEEFKNENDKVLAVYGAAWGIYPHFHYDISAILPN